MSTSASDDFYLRYKLGVVCVIAACVIAIGAQASPQLAINISGARSVGLSREEIAEVFWQMALYGGFPAAISALNVALEVFAEEEDARGQ